MKNKNVALQILGISLVPFYQMCEASVGISPLPSYRMCEASEDTHEPQKPNPGISYMKHAPSTVPAESNSQEVIDILSRGIESLISKLKDKSPHQCKEMAEIFQIIYNDRGFCDQHYTVLNSMWCLPTEHLQVLKDVLPKLCEGVGGLEWRAAILRKISVLPVVNLRENLADFIQLVNSLNEMGENDGENDGENKWDIVYIPISYHFTHDLM